MAIGSGSNRQAATTLSTAYIDANVFKFAATAVVRLFPRKQIIRFDDGASVVEIIWIVFVIKPIERRLVAAAV